MQLTTEQLRFFHRFGFLIFRNLLSEQELEVLASEADEVRDQVYGSRECGPRGCWIPLLTPAAPFSASLIEDQRFHGIATQTFDDSIFGVNVDMMYWNGDTGWHRDLDVPGNTGIKLIYYLEPLTAETGALRVVPGSHIEPHRDDVSDDEPMRLCGSQDDTSLVEAVENDPSDDQLSAVVETKPGDVVAFALPLLHASFGGAPDRRFGAAIYWMPSTTEAQAEARRQESRIIGENHARMFNFPEGVPFCHPDWVAGAAGNSLRERWIAQLRNLDWISD